MARAWPLSALKGSCFLLACCVSCTVFAIGNGAAETNAQSRKLLQNIECVTNAARLYFAGEFRPTSNVCNRCSGGRVAWCCRSDNFATQETCKLASPSTCCAGQEFYYTYIDRDGETDGDSLDDVWCMPSTCTPNFNVNAWPVNPGTFNPAPGNGGGNGNNGPSPVNPTPGGPANTSPECTTTNERRDFVGEFSNARGQAVARRNAQVCRACAARNQTAWCCRSDNFATPETCKLASPSTCCAGQEFYYTYIDREGETDGDSLDDVWCMPSTCTPNFNVNAWPVNPGTFNPAPGNGGGNGNNGPSPVNPTPGGPANTSPECTTTNERRDFVGEFSNARGQAVARRNAQVCRACAARNQTAWCCNSLQGDRASADPANCQPANRNDRCCNGARFRYRYFDPEEGVWDTDFMDDVWCLPNSCSPRRG